MVHREDVFQIFPVIDLGDVVLREIKTSDAADFLEYLSDPMVKRFLSDDEIPKDLKNAETELGYWGDLFKYRRSIYWGIAKKKNNQLIGTCGFNNINLTHARAEISYDLSRREWRKGIMSRSVKAICEFAFSNIRVMRIQATVATDNEASIKLLERNNFQKEGLMRQYGILHKQKKDFYMYSLLPYDLPL